MLPMGDNLLMRQLGQLGGNEALRQAALGSQFVESNRLPPRPKGPTYRVITDTGAEFVIEMGEMSINWRNDSSLGNTLHLYGKIISPTKQPGFPSVQEDLRRIEVPVPQEPRESTIHD